MQSATTAAERRLDLAAATVLYRPDPAVLDALLAPLVEAGLRVFIFANGPLGDDVELRLARLPDLHLVRSPDNVGLGAGLNAVVEAAQSEGFGHVVLFDQDSTPDAALLPRLLDAFFAAQAQPGIRPAAIGPLLVAPANEAFLPPWYSRRPGQTANGVSAVDFLPTSGSLVSIAAWREIGPFRADYFIDGIDVEWCFRAWAKGYACLLAEQLQMVHRWGYVAEAGKRRPQILRQSDLRTFYYLRNAVEGLRQPHMPLRWKFRVATRLAVQSGLLLVDRRGARETRKMLTRAVSDGWCGRLGPAPQPLVSAQ
jgi:rhamnosyltransferase